jgi:oxygen-dependent protoporphyrinogen oxidase
MGGVAVVGGGISGLAAAYRLRQRGVPVTLFEASSRTGGAIGSERADGFLVERGPNALQEPSPVLAEVVCGLALEGQRVFASEAARRRYVVRRGRPVPLPHSPTELLRSSLLSPAAKLRLLREPFVEPAPAEREESVAGFVRRRLGAEILDYAFDPYIAGTFAGVPERLSVRHALPRLYTLEREHGSLLKSLVRGRRAERQHRPPSRLYSFRDGLQTLTDALQARLGGAVRLNTPVRAVRPAGDGWAVTVLDAGREATERFDAVVYAAPLYQLGRLRLDTPIDVGPLASAYHPPLSVLALGFRREDVRHPLDGFGLLVPSVEPFGVLGALFSSTLFPDRAPEGQVLLTTFLGGARRPELALAPTETLLATAQRNLRALLGVTGEPTFVRHIYWPRSIPQYELGYGRLEGIMNRLEGTHPGFFMAGSYRGGIGVGDALRSGLEAAMRVLGAGRLDPVSVAPHAYSSP